MGPKHLRVADALLELGDAHVQLRSSTEAVLILKQSLDIFETELGGESVGAAKAVRLLGVAEASLGQLKAAVDSLERACGIFEREFGPFHCQTKNTRLLLIRLQQTKTKALAKAVPAKIAKKVTAKVSAGGKKATPQGGAKKDIIKPAKVSDLKPAGKGAEKRKAKLKASADHVEEIYAAGAPLTPTTRKNEAGESPKRNRAIEKKTAKRCTTFKKPAKQLAKQSVKALVKKPNRKGIQKKAS